MRGMLGDQVMIMAKHRQQPNLEFATMLMQLLAQGRRPYRHSRTDPFLGGLSFGQLIKNLGTFLAIEGIIPWVMKSRR